MRAPQTTTCDFNTHESYGDKILRDEIYMPIFLKNQKVVAGRKFFCEKNAGSEYNLFFENKPILANFLKGKLADFGFFNFFQKMI